MLCNLATYLHFQSLNKKSLLPLWRYCQWVGVPCQSNHCQSPPRLPAPAPSSWQQYPPPFRSGTPEIVTRVLCNMSPSFSFWHTWKSTRVLCKMSPSFSSWHTWNNYERAVKNYVHHFVYSRTLKNIASMPSSFSLWQIWNCQQCFTDPPPTFNFAKS